MLGHEYIMHPTAELSPPHTHTHAGSHLTDWLLSDIDLQRVDIFSG